MKEGFFLGTREAVEYRLLEEFRLGKRTRANVALRLGISERAVSRRVAKIRAQGVAGIKHGNYRRTPVNRKSDDEKDRAIELAKTTYASFNLRHCHELLVRDHGLQCCYDTFRKWCKAAGLGKRLKRRANTARLQRERMANEGLMLQFDGSPHRWNGRDEWCLIAAIDDATSTIPAGRFFPSETTWACFAVLRLIIERYGLPEILYTDGAGWAGGGPKRQHFSQFVRACKELGIVVLPTSSPEAKGRIERAFRTIQGRLVPELKLAGIKSMTDANRYLDQVFFPTYWNARLTVEPKSRETRYRPLPLGVDLDEVLCMKHWRRVRRDHTVSLDAKNYRLRPGELGSLAGKEVVAHVNEAGEVAWYYGRQRVPSELKQPPRRQASGWAS